MGADQYLFRLKQGRFKMLKAGSLAQIYQRGLRLLACLLYSSILKKMACLNFISMNIGYYQSVFLKYTKNL